MNPNSYEIKPPLVIFDLVEGFFVCFNYYIRNFNMSCLYRNYYWNVIQIWQLVSGFFIGVGIRVLQTQLSINRFKMHAQYWIITNILENIFCKFFLDTILRQSFNCNYYKAIMRGGEWYMQLNSKALNSLYNAHIKTTEFLLDFYLNFLYIIQARYLLLLLPIFLQQQLWKVGWAQWEWLVQSQSSGFHAQWGSGTHSLLVSRPVP